MTRSTTWRKLGDGMTCFTVVAFMATLPVAGADIPGFRFSKTIERPTPQAEEILAVDLDSQVYAATRDGFPDLRVVAQDSRETPTVLEQQTTSQSDRSPRPFAAETISLREEGDGIEIRLRRPPGTPTVDGITFRTPLRDFERHVRIDGSQDGSDWKPLADGFLFDYSRYMDVRQNELVLPSNDFSEFRVIIEEVTDERESPYLELTRTLKQGAEQQRVEQTIRERRPLRLDQISFWHNDVVERPDHPVQTRYPVTLESVTPDEEAKATVVLIQTQRQPLTEFTIETSSRNFSRSVSLQIQHQQGPRAVWTDLAQTTISKLQFRGIDRSQLDVRFAEHRQSTYRLLIHNEDNPPLEITGILASGPVYRLVFLAQPNTNYELRYGSSVAEAPSYEAAAVLGSLRRGNSETVATLGVEVDRGPEAASAPMRRPFDNPWLVGVAVCLVVLVLGWGLFRAARRMPDLDD